MNIGPTRVASEASSERRLCCWMWHSSWRKLKSSFYRQRTNKRIPRRLFTIEWCPLEGVALVIAHHVRPIRLPSHYLSILWHTAVHAWMMRSACTLHDKVHHYVIGYIDYVHEIGIIARIMTVLSAIFWIFRKTSWDRGTSPMRYGTHYVWWSCKLYGKGECFASIIACHHAGLRTDHNYWRLEQK